MTQWKVNTVQSMYNRFSDSRSRHFLLAWLDESSNITIISSYDMGSFVNQPSLASSPGRAMQPIIFAREFLLFSLQGVPSLNMTSPSLSEAITNLSGCRDNCCNEQFQIPIGSSPIIYLYFLLRSVGSKRYCGIIGLETVSTNNFRCTSAHTTKLVKRLLRDLPYFTRISVNFHSNVYIRIRTWCGHAALNQTHEMKSEILYKIGVNTKEATNTMRDAHNLNKRTLIRGTSIIIFFFPH